MESKNFIIYYTYENVNPKEAIPGFLFYDTDFYIYSYSNSN